MNRYKRRKGPLRDCKVRGCSKPSHAYKFCITHHRRYMLHGSPYYTTNERHGLENSPEFKVWSGMKQRCNNPNDKGYIRYGARGIKVCKSWERSFTKFYKDMGPRPGSGYHIDRMNNDKGYSKANCRWVTLQVNMRNRRTTKLSEKAAVEIRKSKLPVVILAKRYGVAPRTIYDVKYNRSWKIIK